MDAVIIWMKGQLPRWIAAGVGYLVVLAGLHGLNISPDTQQLLVKVLNELAAFVLTYATAHKLLGIRWNPVDGSSPGAIATGKIEQRARRRARTRASSPTVPDQIFPLPTDKADD